MHVLAKFPLVALVTLIGIIIHQSQGRTTFLPRRTTAVWQSCNETNVSKKYGTCFGPEEKILSQKGYKPVQECIQSYESVANCIGELGNTCGNGEVATYLRFLYHEFNIRIAGRYACENLQQLRTVVTCVSQHSKKILECRYRYWYSTRMKSYLADATKEERYCWNMGVTVHCRQLYARLCTHHLIYFGYLFSVYPSECQGLPWENEKQSPGHLNPKDCSTLNYINMYVRCFHPEGSVLDGDISNKPDCHSRFAVFRDCLSNLGKSCPYGNIPRVIRRLTVQSTFKKSEDFACSNLKEVQKGAGCIDQYKTIMSTCVQDRRTYNNDKITFVASTNPERAACMLLDIERQCRNEYRYRCQDSKLYYQYLDTIYPNCTQFIPTTRAPPRERCTFNYFINSYYKCFNEQITLITQMDSIWTCRENYDKMIQCIKKLHSECQHTPLSVKTSKLYTAMLKKDTDMDFICSKVDDLKASALCLKLKNSDLDMEQCLTSKNSLPQQSDHLCKFLSNLKGCQFEVLKKRQCLKKADAFFLYREILEPKACYAFTQLPIPQTRNCSVRELYKNVAVCLMRQARVFESIGPFSQKCRSVVEETQQCFQSVHKNCDPQTIRLLKQAYMNDSTVKEISKRSCNQLTDIVATMTCYRRTNNSLNCAKMVTTVKDEQRVTKDSLCKLVDEIKQCFSNDPDCSKPGAYKTYIENIFPMKTACLLSGSSALSLIFPYITCAVFFIYKFLHI